MTTHTPGPWGLVETKCPPIISQWDIRIGDYTVNVWPYQGSPCGYYTDHTRMADARLMAAAPELLGQHEADMVDLDLLAKAIHAGDPLPELVIRITDMLNRKHALIAKATGAQP